MASVAHQSPFTEGPSVRRTGSALILQRLMSFNNPEEEQITNDLP